MYNFEHKNNIIGSHLSSSCNSFDTHISVCKMDECHSLQNGAKEKSYTQKEMNKYLFIDMILSPPVTIQRDL